MESLAHFAYDADRLAAAPGLPVPLEADGRFLDRLLSERGRGWLLDRLSETVRAYALRVGRVEVPGDFLRAYRRTLEAAVLTLPDTRPRGELRQVVDEAFLTDPDLRSTSPQEQGRGMALPGSIGPRSGCSLPSVSSTASTSASNVPVGGSVCQRPAELSVGFGLSYRQELLQGLYPRSFPLFVAHSLLDHSLPGSSCSSSLSIPAMVLSAAVPTTSQHKQSPTYGSAQMC